MQVKNKPREGETLCFYSWTVNMDANRFYKPGKNKNRLIKFRPRLPVYQRMWTDLRKIHVFVINKAKNHSRAESDQWPETIGDDPCYPT
jgi:hypothetical protein